MTRGNQRELARERNMKKKKQDGKKDDGLTVEQRKFRDAELMREKQRRKDDDARKKAEACNKK